MTYDATADSPKNPGGGRPFGMDHDPLGWAKTPGFNPFKLVAVIAGFAIFPPLGVAALVYFIWKSRQFGRHGGGHGMGRGGHCRRHGHSGNAAFDAHREKVMSELEAERQAFDEHRAEQRRKRDQEAYDAFLAARKAEGKKA